MIKNTSRSGLKARPLVWLLVLAVGAPVSAASSGQKSSPQFFLTQGLTFNNNITLLTSDVNFGPAALSRDDITGHLRLDASQKWKQVRTFYSFTRAHFFKNEDLHYLNHYFRTSWEVPGNRPASYYRLSLDYNKFDPDHRVQPDPVTGFPFTTTELPNRRVYNLVLNQELAPRDQVQVQGIAQSLWYENNPVLDNHAEGGIFRYSRLFSKTTTGFLESGQNTKRYQNISDDDGDPRQLKTPQESNAAGVSWVPSSRFGSVMKYTSIHQSANIPDFFLDQWDLSGILAYTPNRGPSAVLTTQRSRKRFPFRAVVFGGPPQDDLEHLVNLQVSWKLALAARGILTLTYDRNRSNNTEFDYVNRIAAFEVRESF